MTFILWGAVAVAFLAGLVIGTLLGHRLREHL